MQISAIRLSGNAVDVTAGLTGCFLAQVRPRSATALYATASSAPADTDQYFIVHDGRFFTFRAGTGCEPTWVRTLDPLVTASLAVAKLDD